MLIDPCQPIEALDLVSSIIPLGHRLDRSVLYATKKNRLPGAVTCDQVDHRLAMPVLAARR